MFARDKSVAAIRKALQSDDPVEALAAVRSLVPDDGEGPQQVVVYAYACILEVNSAGLSILFDRFEDDELARCQAAFEAIGAERTQADFRTLHALYAHALAKGKDRLAASEWVVEHPDARLIDRQSDMYVNELESALLAYCDRHAEDIAAGGLA